MKIWLNNQKDMYTVDLNTSNEQCMALMNEHHFRHLPVDKMIN